MNRFFIAHIFFLVAFLALLGAAVLVLKRHWREWKPLTLAVLPLAMIFLTAYLGKNAPSAHQAVNVVYDALQIYNAYYFRKRGETTIFRFYIAAIVGTALDFAMHFVIRMR
jgi:uncharacterized membrane protein YozB (DUF420 family)